MSPEFDDLIQAIWEENAGNISWKLTNLSSLKQDPKLVLREMIALAVCHSKSAIPVEVLCDPQLLRKAMLHVMMQGLLTRKTQMVIGSAGGSGGRPHIAWQLEIMDEVACAMERTFMVAVIDTTLDKADLKKKLQKGKITPLQHNQPLTEEGIDRTTETVAQIGVEPIIQALNMNPDIVLSGRACGNACFAADPVRKGYDKGLALHLGKIVECASA